MKNKTLKQVKVGDKVTVKNIKTSEHIKRRLHDIGLINGTEITCVGESLWADPKLFLIRGGAIALRLEECSCIYVE